MGQRWPSACTLRWSPASGEGGRRRTCLLIVALICCSPVLIPLACVSFPLICIVGLCLQARRRRPRNPPGWESGGASVILGLCQEQEALAMEPRLLCRYLEDQLRLVGGELLVLDCDGGGGGH
ncbi:hypothetical protein B296_00058425 [Ensete ventricosum]|uniref:Uncharacterized protein n=1 Tax=Ensete ventricosum TaxID=4639 RepID=A0A426X2A8_ENSVE|nr:hypothetical protein B296_00058425 [Ensete ventricosum]